MNETLERAYEKLRNFAVIDFFEIVILFLVIYFVFYLLKRNNAKWLIIAMVSVILVGAVCVMLEMPIIANWYKYIIFGSLFIVLIIFSGDIRRDILRVNMHYKNIKLSTQDVSQEEIKEVIDEMVRACQKLAKNNVGALIVIEKTAIPNHIINSGIIIDSRLSSSMLESVFNTKSPLHDGAVIIRVNRILTAGCFLPLSQEINIPKDLGTRHRAALGMAESYDALVIVISEETGVISIAENGKLTRYLNGEMLMSKLEKVYGIDTDEQRNKKSSRRRKNNG